MIHPMHFHMPTDEEIHTAFEQGEAAVMAVFHTVATWAAALAQQLAKQGAMLQELQARLAKNSSNSGKPPSSDGYGKGSGPQACGSLVTSPMVASRAMRARR